MVRPVPQVDLQNFNLFKKAIKGSLLVKTMPSS